MSRQSQKHRGPRQSFPHGKKPHVFANETNLSSGWNCNERQGREDYAREGGARGEVVRATSMESSNATATISNLSSTGIIAMLIAGVKNRRTGRRAERANMRRVAARVRIGTQVELAREKQNREHEHERTAGCVFHSCSW